MKLIAIRHGLTEGNNQKILKGQRLDMPLIEEGRAQAKAIATVLQQEGHKAAALYASPLLRAHQTAEYIAAALDLPILSKEELKEADFGALSGRRWDQIPENKNNALKKLYDSFQYDFQPFGGEHVTQVRTRLQALLNFLKNSHYQETVICVTHGGILRLLHDELQIPQPLEIPPGSVHHIPVVTHY